MKEKIKQVLVHLHLYSIEVKLHRFLIMFYREILRLLPIKKNKIVFMSYSGKGYSCNPKYIAEEIIKQEKKWKLVWLVNDLSTYMPKEIKKIKLGSFRSYCELATAKIWINNARNSIGIRKKKKQIYIQTWHASFSQKKLEGEAEDKLQKTYIEEAKKDGRIANIIISNSVMQTKDFRDNFWIEGEIVEWGNPRNDIFLKKDSKMDERIYNLKQKYSIKEDDYVVLYAPTFREQEGFQYLSFNCLKLVKTFKEKVNKNIKLLIRMHPNITNEVINEEESIFNVSMYPDMQDLLMITNFLITDYSSSVFDFNLLKRPSMLYVPDLEEYELERGLKPFFYELPYIKVRSEEELLDEIRRFNFEDNYCKLIQFQKKFPSYDDGEASKKVVNFIEKVIDR